MPTTDAVASRLGTGLYRFRDDQWEHHALGEWVASTVLEGYSYEEGVAVVAACNWTDMVEVWARKRRRAR